MRLHGRYAFQFEWLDGVVGQGAAELVGLRNNDTLACASTRVLEYSSFDFVQDTYFVKCWASVGWPTIAVLIALLQSFLFKTTWVKQRRPVSSGAVAAPSHTGSIDSRSRYYQQRFRRDVLPDWLYLALTRVAMHFAQSSQYVYLTISSRKEEHINPNPRSSPPLIT